MKIVMIACDKIEAIALSKADDLEIFKNNRFGEVRTIKEDGKVLFVASDVAKALGYARPLDAISAHCRYTTKRSIPHPQSPDKTIEVNVIEKGDIFRLAAKSELDGADEFESWIFDDVVPSVLKDGVYMTPDVLEQALLDPDYLIKLATQIKTEREGRIVAEHKIKELQPKAEFFDAVTCSNDAIDIGTVARVINFSKGRTTLFRILRENKILMSDNLPYQEFRDRGYFRVIESTFTNPRTGDVHTNYKTVVYQKGVDFIRRLLIKQGYQKEVS
jgi:prophage antirepressor-like protein